jgi:hypothetical protein
MAVVSVKESTDRRRSQIKDGKRSEVRVFIVKCDDPRDGTAAAVTGNDGARAVPMYKEQHPVATMCVASSIEANPIPNTPLHFEVVAEYTDGDVTDQPVHPLERPWDFAWGAVEFTEPYFVDRSPVPKPVVNSAGDTFENNFERDSGEMTITLTRNEATHDANEAETYSHTVNDAVVTLDDTGYARGTLKMSPITAQKVTETWQGEQVVYYRKTYIIKARRNGWHDQPLDLGFNELKDVVTGGRGGREGGIPFKQRTPIVDAASLRVQKPWPLDGTGKRKLNATDTPATLDFQPYTEVSWSALQFV